LTHVDAYRITGNGRGAFLALRILCDNPRNAHAQAEITRNLLKSLYWNRGPPEFDKFVEQSLRCHQDLERYGHPLSELDKVLYCRKSVASHPKFDLMSAVEGQGHSASFQSLIEFIRGAMVINGVISAPARSELRRVAAARTRGGGRSDKGNRDSNRKSSKSGKSNNDKDKRSSKGKRREHPKARHPSTTRNYGRLPKSKVPIQLEPYPWEFYDSIVEHGEEELLKTERDKINKDKRSSSPKISSVSYEHNNTWIDAHNNERLLSDVPDPYGFDDASTHGTASQTTDDQSQDSKRRSAAAIRLSSSQTRPSPEAAPRPAPAAAIYPPAMHPPYGAATHDARSLHHHQFGRQLHHHSVPQYRDPQIPTHY
jgi:hypothetical protein